MILLRAERHSGYAEPLQLRTHATGRLYIVINTIRSSSELVVLGRGGGEINIERR
jgi:hypothetical protein